MSVLAPFVTRSFHRFARCAIVAALLSGGIPSAANAEEPTASLKKMSLEELFDLEVTTVSRKPESLSRTPAAVHVVTAEDLRRSGALSIADALRNVPGVEVARVDARQYSITVRGFNGTIANKLLVLMDGRSLYTPLFSGVFWDVQDTFLEDVAQIEVVRGPGGTVWGANAVNGVINVITKDAAQTQGMLVTSGMADLERGFGGVRYGGRLGTQGFFRVYAKTFDRGPSVRPSGVDAGDRWQMHQGGVRMDWAPAGPHAFSLQGDLYEGAEQQPTTGDVNVYGGNLQAKWTRHFSASSDLQIDAYYDHTDRDIPTTFGELLDTYDAQVRHRFQLAERHDITWGVGYRHSEDEVTNSAMLAFLPAHVTRRLFTCFLQEEVSLADDRARITLGSKVEHNDYTGFEVQPGIRFAFSPRPSHTLWGALSRAVRTPSRIDRDLYAPAAPPYLLAGGPGFASENLRAWEIGYKAQPSSALTASVAGFYNQYDDLRSLEVGPPAILANNLEGCTHGAETELAWQARPSWRLSGGCTLLELRLRRKPGSTDVSQIRQNGDSPQVQSFVRSWFTLPRDVEVDLTVRQVGRLINQQVPGYVTADLHLGWQPMRGMEVGLHGRDLFTPHHAEFGPPASRREVPRSLYGKITWRL